MNIAFLVTEFPSISQTFVLNQITGLLDRGHQVDIFALSSPKNGKYHPDVLKYDLIGKTTYFPEIPGNRLWRLLKALQYGFYPIFSNPKAMLRSLNVIKYDKQAASLTLLYRIVPFLTKGAFDIVHCHFGPMGLIAAQCKSTGALKGKLITAFHGYDLTSYLQTNGQHVYDRLFDSCDLFMPISDHWKNKLISIGCPESKIQVHRMGVDIHQHDIKPRYERTDDNISILSVARLVEKKGITFAIQAMPRVIDRFPNIKYRIAGDGPLRNELENQVRMLGLQEHVFFQGWMDQDEIAQLMKQSDILIAPSISSSSGDQEGIPVVLMEALSMGIPVISTLHSGIPELIQDGKSGFLVPEKNVDMLTERLIYLIENERLWSEFGRNGREYVEHHYDSNKLNAQLEETFERLVARMDP